MCVCYYCLTHLGKHSFWLILCSFCALLSGISHITDHRVNNYSWGNDFATLKNFRTKYFLINIFSGYIILKWFCNDKKFSTKHFWVGNYTWGDYFATIYYFRPKKFLVKIFSGLLFLRKWFSNNKNVRPKKFFD